MRMRYWVRSGCGRQTERRATEIESLRNSGNHGSRSFESGRRHVSAKLWRRVGTEADEEYVQTRHMVQGKRRNPLGSVTSLITSEVSDAAEAVLLSANLGLRTGLDGSVLGHGLRFVSDLARRWWIQRESHGPVGLVRSAAGHELGLEPHLLRRQDDWSGKCSCLFCASLGIRVSLAAWQRVV